jgi:hypothetical protein
MITRYKEFMEDMLLERLLNEAVLYYSPEFRRRLRKINSDISKDIIKLNNTDIEQDMTLIDISDQEGFISFVASKNIKDELTDKELELENPENNVYISTYIVNKLFDNSDPITKKSRNNIRLGKFINKILPGKYNSEQIEKFVNLFKSKGGEGEFKLVKGTDINKWYKSENLYYDDKGDLGSSCMTDKDIFDLYTKNPEVCQLLVLLKEGLLIGRALVWKVSYNSEKELKGVEYYMDRQYCAIDSDVNKFIDYAKKMGWMYKAVNNSITNDFIYDDKVYSGVRLEVQLNDIKYYTYPYLDTFRVFDPIKKTLININNINDDYEKDIIGFYYLIDTNGYYEIIEKKVYSNYQGYYIPISSAVWSKHLNDWLSKYTSVNVNVGSKENLGWYPKVDRNIIYDQIKGRFFHKDDSVYSSTHETYLLKSEVIKVAEDIDPDDYYPVTGPKSYSYPSHSINIKEVDMKWSDYILELPAWKKMHYIYISSDVMEVNYNGELIPYVLKLNFLKIGDLKLKEIDALSLTSSNLLNLENGMSNKNQVIDKFEYYDSLTNELIKEIYHGLKKLKDSDLSNILYKDKYESIKDMESGLFFDKSIL